MYGLRQLSATGQPQPTVCLWSLMLFDVLGVLSVLIAPRVCLELTSRTTRTKQALSHGRRSSFIVHRSSFIVLFKLSIVYRLSGILRSYAPCAPTLPTAPGVFLPIAHPSAADIADIATLQSLEHEHEHERPGCLAVSAEHRVIMIRVRRRRAVGPGREREGEKARAKGRRMEKEDTGRGRTPS